MTFLKIGNFVSIFFLTRAVIRIKSRTGKSAEDLRKLFPNFYISNWSRNGNSTPATPAVSGRLSRPPPVNPGISSSFTLLTFLAVTWKLDVAWTWYYKDLKCIPSKETWRETKSPCLYIYIYTHVPIYMNKICVTYFSEKGFLHQIFKTLRGFNWIEFNSIKPQASNF